MADADATESGFHIVMSLFLKGVKRKPILITILYDLNLSGAGF